MDRNKKEWRKTRRRRTIRADEKRRIASNLNPTTIFDFLWRLRVRANYRDVESFLTWNVDDSDHETFAFALVTVTATTCLLLENLLIRKGGRSLYESLSSSFFADHTGALGDSIDFLEQRRQVRL